MNILNKETITSIENLIMDLDRKKAEIELQRDINQQYLIDYIRNYCVRLRYNDELVRKYLKDKTITGDEKKVAKSTYKALCDLIISIFDQDANYKYKNNIVEDISYYGYSKDAVAYHFTVNGLKFSLNIPNVKNLNSEKFMMYWKGQIVIFYEETDWRNVLIAAGYDYEDLDEPFNKWMRENCAEEKAKISQKKKNKEE